jgi:DNA-directed RNA polymerase specialized sigma24 family protein
MAKNEKMTAVELGVPVNVRARDTLARMSDEEWRKLILRLASYAVRVSREYRWRTGNPHELPNGEAPDSIVSEAITRVLTGDRKWNPEEQRDLAKYLMDVIDSIMWHLATGQDNRTLFVNPANGETNDETNDEEPSRGIEDLVAPTPPPEQILLEREKSEICDRAMQMLVSECENDDVLREMLNLMQDGVLKRAELAERLGRPVKEIYSASKRLDRKYRIVANQIRAQIGANRDQ